MQNWIFGRAHRIDARGMFAHQDSTVLVDEVKIMADGEKFRLKSSLMIRLGS